MKIKKLHRNKITENMSQVWIRKKSQKRKTNFMYVLYFIRGMEKNKQISMCYVENVGILDPDEIYLIFNILSAFSITNIHFTKKLLPNY